jgi:hypothetical protein
MAPLDGRPFLEYQMDYWMAKRAALRHFGRLQVRFIEEHLAEATKVPKLPTRSRRHHWFGGGLLLRWIKYTLAARGWY